MSELNALSQETLEQLTDLSEQAEQVESALDGSEERLNGMLEVLESKYTTLTATIEATLEKTDAEHQDLITESDQTNALLENLKERLAELQESVNEQLTETTERIVNLQEQVPVLKSNLVTVYENGEAIRTVLLAKINNLDTTVASSIQLLDSHLTSVINTEIAALQDQVTERASNFENYIVEECVPALENKLSEFGENIVEVVTAVDNKLENLGEIAEEALNASVEEVFSWQEERFSGVINSAKQLEELMARLTAAIDTTGTAVVTTNAVMADSVTLTNSGMETALGLLDEVYELLDNFSV